MSDNTHIEWTDATWNPITGCSVVSAGCKHCYAMKLAGTRLQHHPSRAGLTIETNAGPVWNGQVRFNGDWLHQPMSWRRPRRIFVCAHGDLFHESVPDEWIDMVFAVMALSPQHTFQVLTKRPKRMRDYLAEATFERMLSRFGAPPDHLFNISRMELRARLTGGLGGAYARERRPWPLPNVWCGVSVENQATADERIPLLLQCPAAVRWISAEPLLGPVNFRWAPYAHRANGESYREYLERNGSVNEYEALRKLHWVVVGGESAPGTVGYRSPARPMHPDWARSLRDQCAAAGVPFLFKQWGNFVPHDIDPTPGKNNGAHGYVRPDGTRGDQGEYWDGKAAGMNHVGKKAAGRLLDGVLHDNYPVVAS